MGFTPERDTHRIFMNFMEYSTYCIYLNSICGIFQKFHKSLSDLPDLHCAANFSVPYYNRTDQNSTDFGLGNIADKQ